MKYIVDIALIALFFFIVNRASHKGFLIGILGVAAWIGASLFAASFSFDVAQWVYNAFFERRVTEWIASQVTESVGAQAVVDTAKAVIESIPQYAVSAAKALGISTKELLESIGSVEVTAADAIAGEITTKIAQPIITAALEALSFMVLIFSSSAVFHSLAGLINKFTKIPVLKQVNNALGALLGVAKGIVVVVLICVLLNIFMNIAGDGAFANAVESSRFVKAVCESGLMLEF
jgi:uncharacterized membrane protein required for colicin V production